MSNPDYVWHCPSCRRQVPRRIEACRCGFERPADLSDGDEPVTASAAEPVRRGPNPLLLGLFLGLAVAATMLWGLREDRPPQRATLATSDPGAEGSAESPDEPVAPAALLPISLLFLMML